VGRVVFDARDAAEPEPRGWGRYTRELLAALERRGDLDILPLTRGWPGPEVGWEQVALPRILRREQAALVHAPNCFLPLQRPCPGVVTVHDLAWEEYPDDFAWTTGWKYRALVPRAAQSAERVICVSEFTRADVVRRYEALWSELTREDVFGPDETYRIDERLRRLNGLGFDVEEVQLVGDAGGQTLRLNPQVVEPGHHRRRLHTLTGLDVQENQARRLLNDLDSYRAAYGKGDLDEEMVAHEWLMRVFEPVVRAIPVELRGKLEPAEVFHQLLEHRWFMAQQAGHDIPLAEAVSSYVNTVLRHRRDEATVIGPPSTTRPL